MRQFRLLPELILPTIRAVRWGPMAVSGTFSLALLVFTLRPGEPVEIQGVVTWLRIVTVTGIIGSAFLLDDPSRPTTEAVTCSILLRRILRAAVALPPMAAWWGTALVYAMSLLPSEAPLPIRALTLEAAALFCVTMAMAAASIRHRPEWAAGTVVAPALFVMIGIGLALPDGLALFVDPPNPPISTTSDWHAAHQRWGGVLCLAILVVLFESRDPARGLSLR